MKYGYSNNYGDILAAVKSLASVCDGASSKDHKGFNGTDTEFGHSLATRESLTVNQAKAAYKMLKKYHKQLNGLGYNYEALVDPNLTSMEYATAFAYVNTMINVREIIDPIMVDDIAFQDFMTRAEAKFAECLQKGMEVSKIQLGLIRHAEKLSMAA